MKHTDANNPPQHSRPAASPAPKKTVYSCSPAPGKNWHITTTSPYAASSSHFLLGRQTPPAGTHKCAYGQPPNDVNFFKNAPAISPIRRDHRYRPNHRAWPAAPFFPSPLSTLDSASCSPTPLWSCTPSPSGPDHRPVPHITTRSRLFSSCSVRLQPHHHQPQPPHHQPPHFPSQHSSTPDDPTQLQLQQSRS